MVKIRRSKKPRRSQRGSSLRLTRGGIFTSYKRSRSGTRSRSAGHRLARNSLLAMKSSAIDFAKPAAPVTEACTTSAFA